MNSQDKRNLSAARAMYAGDEAERANIARNIVWHVPGHNQVSGDYYGYAAYTEVMVGRMAPLDRWDFNLVKAPVTDDAGFPVQQRGVAGLPGLYFVGMPWLHTQKSGLLAGVGEDAAYIAAHIAQRSVGAAGV